jgi:hypothetical protein
MFAAVVMLVCAVASRYSNDPRVLLDGVDSWHSCGWKYFDQVQVVRKSLLAPPTLYDLQFYCVSTQFQVFVCPALIDFCRMPYNPHDITFSIYIAFG